MDEAVPGEGLGYIRLQRTHWEPVPRIRDACAASFSNPPLNETLFVGHYLAVKVRRRYTDAGLADRTQTD